MSSDTTSNINQVTAEVAAQSFMSCCTSSQWVQGMVANRPYLTEEKLRATANDIWSELGESDFLEAFEGHPKIGDVESLAKKYAQTKHLAGNEQSAIATASADVLNALKEANDAYLAKFGFIFIICATGKTATEMLDSIQSRLENSRDQEVLNAAEEQRKILQIRLSNIAVDE